MLVEIKYSEDSIWRNTDAGFCYVKDSYNNFEQVLSEKILGMWPNAKIEFSKGLKDSYTVEGDPSSDDSIRLEEVFSRAWGEFNWLCS